MKRHRKNKYGIPPQIREFLKKYGIIIFTVLAGLFLGKFIMPMIMR